MKKIKLILPDYLILTAIVLMFGCHSITHYLVAKHTTMAETQEEANRVIEYVEQNPITAWTFKFGKWSYVLTEFLVPGVMAGMYYLFRTKYGREAAMAYSLTAVVVFLGNFLNDGAYLMAYLTQIGMFG